MKSFKMQWNGYISAKWQLVIPKRVRALLGLEPWTQVSFITKQDKAVVIFKSENMDSFLQAVKDMNEDIEI